ncbi:MATE family efflux transporter [Ruminococcus albus]|uniref:Multidrug export protein MepA n=1 Tax=Ruminococcus albus (strain ATCC 27210 / DSM 20455 / JCM 14654 / NCDO 2250 / 7) TaxID=697329 RepID=E6UG63_RUMA7|nr:MATE family efflux transporter [Ruminococcus albus]ADU21090.1 MATE efflux family protein [Ruminococcus albus 7 = DSM 20455]
MNEVREKNPLGYQKIPMLLCKFALPSVIAMLVSSLYNVVDQIFIGKGVGPLGNAATGVAFPLTTICMAITLAIGIGTASRYSLYLGKHEEEKAASTVGCSLCMMIGFGILLTVVTELFLHPMLMAFGATKYVYPYAYDYTKITALGMPFIVVMNCMSNLARADGSPRYSMITMIIGAVINTVLDPIFIFKFDWGVSGAAWATVIGQVVSGLFALTYLKKLKRITLRREHIRLSLREMLTTLTMGMSNGLTQIALTLVQIVMNRSLTKYGELSPYGSDIPLAASTIVMKVNSIVLAIIIGILQGMQPIVGFNYSARQYERVKRVYKLAIKCELVITIIAFAIFQVFPKQVLSLFDSSDNQETALYFDFAVKFMRTFLLLLPLTGVQMISSNFFAAIGKPIKGAVLSLTRQVLFLIPLVLILSHFFGLNGIMAAAPLSDLIAFIVVMVFIKREIDQMDTVSKILAEYNIKCPI